MYLYTPFLGNSLAKATGGITESERLAHYSELAAQFREWAEGEANEEARQGLLDMARQYERLVAELKARLDEPGTLDPSRAAPPTGPATRGL